MLGLWLLLRWASTHHDRRNRAQLRLLGHVIERCNKFIRWLNISNAIKLFNAYEFAYEQRRKAISNVWHYT